MTQYNIQPNLKNHFSDENSFINFERIWYRILRYWYFVAASLFMGLFLAFIYNRYETRIYPLSASIIIKESEEAGQTAELLYNNPLINSYRNFLNEPYIIRSFPLMQQVVDSLGFTVVFYGEGNIKTTERYVDFPVKITGNKRGNNYLTGTFDFVLFDKNTYQITRTINNEDTLHLGATFTGQLNDSLVIDGYKLYVEAGNIGDNIKQDFILTFVDGFSLAKSYASRLNVDWAEEGSSVVNLSINSTTPPKEIDFLNKLIYLYARQDQDKKREVALSSKNFIDRQLQSIADSLLIIEKQLEEFKDKNVITNLDVKAKEVLLQMDELEKAKSSFYIKSSYYDYLEDYLKDNNNLSQVVLPTALGIEDPVLVQLISEMMELQMQVKSLDFKTEKENPLANNMFQRITNLRESILVSINTLKVTDKIAVDQLDRQLAAYEGQLSVLPRAERQFVTIQRTYRLGENLYNFLSQKRSEAAISEASTVSDVITVNHPHLAGGAISPKIRLNYSIALFLGLTIPFGFFVFKEMFNKSVQSKDDIEKTTNIPIIGVIGHNDDPDRMVVSNRPKSSLAEAFRSLRSNLNYFIKQEKFTLMLTSSISGEGKSFTALNLANIFALSGKKTIIVGADMRKPRIFQELDLSNSLGLSNYLSGQVPKEEITQQTRIENLYVISSGPVPPNPGELILRPDFKALLDYLQQHYDIILIDTPPIGLVADALEIATYVNHTLFITRQNYTPLEAIASVDQQVKQGKLSNMSFVFNDIYKFGPGYGYSYGYGYGYGYGRKKKNGGGYYED